MHKYISIYNKKTGTEQKEMDVFLHLYYLSSIFLFMTIYSTFHMNFFIKKYHISFIWKNSIKQNTLCKLISYFNTSVIITLEIPKFQKKPKN